MLVLYRLSIALCALFLTSFTLGTFAFDTWLSAILSVSRTTGMPVVNNVEPLLLVKNVWTCLFSPAGFVFVKMPGVVP